MKMLDFLVTRKTEIIFLILGTIFGWLISRYYFRRASKEAPEWAKPLLNSLPSSRPTDTQLISLFLDYLRHNPLKEEVENANGEVARYKDGRQTCKGKFSVAPGLQKQELNITFPAMFFSDPSVELSGDISRILSKRATASTMLISVTPSNTETLEFSYQATGNWCDPTIIGGNEKAD
ncbi:hypothetical protein ACW5WU_10190 [Aeromonas encheleia]|uniref:hypothetical protein n=1 Tax=Aeromonas encheleia TaxID=73010 RepID=UPI000F82B9CA|nr:hypothetical protein [Aeromonas encheleia]